MQCPVQNCEASFKVASSFRSHQTRNHRQWKHTQLKSHCIDRADDVDFFEGNNDVTDCHEAEDAEQDDDAHDANYACTAEELTRNLALFCMRLQAKVMLPSSTIQSIIGEILNINSRNLTYISSRLESALVTSGELDSGLIQGLLKEVRDNDLLRFCHGDTGPLHTEHTQLPLCSTAGHQVSD